MLHATMRGDAVGALAGFFLPKLLKCEDFDRFEEEAVASMRSLAPEAVERCVEAFDARLRAQAPRSWSVHERAGRTLLTLTGEVSFSHTVFLDEFAGAARSWTSCSACPSARGPRQVPLCGSCAAPLRGPIARPRLPFSK